MPDRQRHRGAHPADPELFAQHRLPILRRALSDYTWLLDRGYSGEASLKLVGDRFQLRNRQRQAVWRAAARSDQVQQRLRRRVPVDQLRDQRVAIDGYNLLITVEAWLSGGFLFIGRDGCVRDLASVHGTYRKVEETLPAVHRIADWLAHLGVSGATWYLDAPVSNSGRLRALLLEVAAQFQLPWEVEVVPDPDGILKQALEIVITTDGVILDAPVRWFDPVASCIGPKRPSRWIDLREPS